MQEIDEAVNQAVADAGLPPDADSLDYTAFLRLLNADMTPAQSHSMTKFPSMAHMPPHVLPSPAAAAPSFSGMLKRACSTTLRRRSMTGVRAASLDPVGEACTDGDQSGAGQPGHACLKKEVRGALGKEANGCKNPPRMHGNNARTGARSQLARVSVSVPCMDASLARAALQPTFAGAAMSGFTSVARSEFGGGGEGGGGDGLPPVDLGGNGDGGAGGGRGKLARGSSWDGEDEEALARGLGVSLHVEPAARQGMRQASVLSRAGVVPQVRARSGRGLYAEDVEPSGVSRAAFQPA